MNYSLKNRLLDKRKVWSLSDAERAVVGGYSEDKQRVLLIRRRGERYAVGRYYPISEIT